LSLDRKQNSSPTQRTAGSPARLQPCCALQPLVKDWAAKHDAHLGQNSLQNDVDRPSISNGRVHSSRQQKTVESSASITLAPFFLFPITTGERGEGGGAKHGGGVAMRPLAGEHVHWSAPPSSFLSAVP
jgi:hypothetical protein